MKYDLNSIDIHKDLQYETIYTSINNEGVKNSGAFAFRYLGEDKVMCRIFEGSQTLANIQQTKQYVVNITQDPIIFTESTIGKLDESYYTDDEDIAILKDAGSYLVIDVDTIEEKLPPKDFPIQNDSKIYFIYGTIKDFVINDETIKAFNRGLFAILESLVNFSRYTIVDDEKRKYYQGRLNENKRIIGKVADDKTKEAMNIIVKAYEEN